MISNIFMETPPHIGQWIDDLQPRRLEEVVREPDQTAIFCVDLVVGTCRSGAFASKRIDALSKGIAELLDRASMMGVRRVVMLHDAHRPDCPEFRAFPSHCIDGSDEACLLPELMRVRCAEDYVYVEKNSINPAVGTAFNHWLKENQDLKTGIVVGAFTDLSVYQLAMHLRFRSNAMNVSGARVIVPENLVNTYNWSEESALQIGFMAHPGDFFHQVFLYHMALNGVQVVKELN